MSGATRKAVLYARVSTKEQAQRGYGIRQQIEACWQWTEVEGYSVLEVVQDQPDSMRPEKEEQG
jgi:DNA invertase Pin-like site-specific DNA recombinase